MITNQFRTNRYIFKFYTIDQEDQTKHDDGITEEIFADTATAAWILAAEIAGRRTQMIRRIKLIRYEPVAVTVEK